MSARLFGRLAGVSGALAVAAGAYGAHGFRRSDRDEYLKELFETANKYHFLHSLALLGVPHCRAPLLAGSLLTTGMVMFCGSLYYQALTGDSTFTKAAPYGGSLLIFGWVAMAF
ncbi:transmembrane protein 256 [Callorhinchus milii]|uniref:Transmembrane protein 256 n=1 Tax=Callorhinchus milii TaxID=7868 RepID=V9LIU6_CALMI|nr:transmembrane protein 256 [Callorhinchus milii]|eukprot:gi/632990801/ref/XP_007884337.1/ PREDICTED: transmembrane protein 256 [Callorhinchus milii]